MSVRLHALLALAQFGDAAAGRAALLLADASGGVRVNAIAVVSALRVPGACARLVRAGEDGKWYVRQAVASALGVLGCRAARPLLRRLQQDPRQAVARAAGAALAAIEASARGARAGRPSPGSLV